MKKKYIFISVSYIIALALSGGDSEPDANINECANRAIPDSILRKIHEKFR